MRSRQDGGGTPYFEANGAVWIDPLQSAVDVWVEAGLVEPWLHQHIGRSRAGAPGGGEIR